MSRARLRRSISELGAVIGAVLAFAGVLVVQPKLAVDVHKVQQRDDVFLLPPASQLRALTFGYRSAATDLQWARLVLEYGTHWQEHRPFPDIDRYLDGILALEPDHPALYLFVDTMICFTPVGATEEDARKARRYLERGIKERPYDAEVWLHYGQFIAFLAPSFLKDPAEIDRWRHDGAVAIARSVELGADPDKSLSVATILSKSGEKQAAVQHLQRAWAMTDDPETRRQFAFKLEKLNASAEAEKTTSVVEAEWRAKYPFVSRGTALMLGPGRDPARCAGTASFERRGCAGDWSTATNE